MQAAERTEATLAQDQATSYKLAHPSPSSPSPELGQQVLSVRSLRHMSLESKLKAGWAIHRPVEKRPGESRRLSRHSGDRGQRRKRDQHGSNTVHDDLVRNECEEPRSCPRSEADMVPLEEKPVRVPEQALENLLSERMLREQQKNMSPGSTGTHATSLLLPACLESKSGGAMQRQPRLALRISSTKQVL